MCEAGQFRIDCEPGETLEEAFRRVLNALIAEAVDAEGDDSEGGS